MKHLILPQLKLNRPNLSESSLKTYISLLTNVFKHLRKEGDDETLEWFDKNEKHILESMNDMQPSRRKTTLSALFILTKSDKVHEQMLADAKSTNETYKDQKMSVKEHDNWITTDEIKEIYDSMKSKVILMFKNKLPLEYDLVNKFFLLGCLAGCSGIPPRRSLDYALMKIKNFDKTTDNYYQKDTFVYNKYKTSAHYGQQQIDVKKDAPEFNKMIKKWITINPTDYLLFSSNQQPLTSSQISKMLNKIFDKHVSVDMLRHIFLTETYKDIPALKQMDQLASDMGHSFNQAMLYVKKS